MADSVQSARRPYPQRTFTDLDRDQVLVGLHDVDADTMRELYADMVLEERDRAQSPAAYTDRTLHVTATSTHETLKHDPVWATFDRVVIHAGAPDHVVAHLYAVWLRRVIEQRWDDQRGVKTLPDGSVFIPGVHINVQTSDYMEFTNKVCNG